MSESLDLWRGVPWLFVSWIQFSFLWSHGDDNIFFLPFFKNFFPPFQKSKKYTDMSWARKQKLLKNFGKSRHMQNVLSETFQSDKNQNISLRLQPL